MADDLRRRILCQAFDKTQDQVVVSQNFWPVLDYGWPKGVCAVFGKSND